MKLAFIGSGQVGASLASNLRRAGHDVTLMSLSRSSESVLRAVARDPSLKLGTTTETVREADVVFLATPFAAVSAALEPLIADLRGKILVDCTNPVGPGISHGLGSAESGTERVQRLVPETSVVKAFSIYGFENLESSAYPAYDVVPAMLFCGKDASAKRVVAQLIAELGFEPLDVGGIEQALHLEHMTLLWIRMVRVSGSSPQMVWGALRR